MNPLHDRIRGLAELMQEFGLSEVRYSEDGIQVEFIRYTEEPGAIVATAPLAPAAAAVAAPAAAAPQGTPVSSPMMGIFYAAASPSDPPFVKVGDQVTAGQVVGLVEAMKVFNEITSPVTGTVKSIAVEGGALVQPGQPLLFIG